MSFRRYTASDWASPDLLALIEEADRIEDSLPPGSTERALIAEAIRKIELADTYVEKRLREAIAPNAEDLEEQEREEMRLDARDEEEAA